MDRVLDAVQAIAVTVWVGALWTSGLVVAPLLFEMLDDRTLAGSVAGRVFELTAWIGLVCGACILFIRFVFRRRRGLHNSVLWLVIAILVLALIGQFGIQPLLAGIREQAYPQPVMQSVLGARFAFWHAVATLIYLAQCLLGAALVVSNSRGASVN